MTFTLLIVLALLIEAIVTTLAWVVDSKFNWQRVAALVIAVVVALLTGMDMFTIVGLPLQYPIFGPILTGLILARGANALNDLFRSFQAIGKLNTGLNKDTGIKIENP